MTVSSDSTTKTLSLSFWSIFIRYSPWNASGGVKDPDFIRLILYVQFPVSIVAIVRFLADVSRLGRWSPSVTRQD
jgi:hypothetical protein